VGWAVLSGDGEVVGNFHHAMDLLGALRLCANVPGQYAVEAAVNGPDTISALCASGGRLYETRRAVIEACEASEHLVAIELAHLAGRRLDDDVAERHLPIAADGDHIAAAHAQNGRAVILIHGSQIRAKPAGSSRRERESCEIGQIRPRAPSPWRAR
jgi:hypothetical protein